jgi:hypothetical protein
VEFYFDLIRVLDEADTSMIEMKHTVGECGAQNLEQVGAMKVIVRCTEVLFAQVGQALASEKTAVVPPMDFNRKRSHRDSAQHVGQAEPVQDSGGVGTNLDTRADLAQLGRLFVHRNLDARSAKRQCGRESADSCAYHDNSHCFHSPDG